jgi:hypothetical protein
MNANTYDSPSTTGGNREDLRDVLTILAPEETPFTSMVSKGPSPKATFTEVLGDTLRKPRITGTREGADANTGGNKAVKRQRFGNYAQRIIETFGVTDVQQIISERGGVAAVSNEYDWAKAKAMREVKRDIEARLCCNDEMQGGSDDEMETRGAFAWLISGSQTTNAVPTDFMPAAAAVVSGKSYSGTKLTEADLYGILQSLGSAGGKGKYDLIAGRNLVKTVDNFTRLESTSVSQRYQVNEDAGRREISMMVELFVCSQGTVRVIPTDFNKLDANQDGDPEAGLVLDMDLWQLQFLDALHSMDLDDEGGGPSGYLKAIFTLACFSPKGNGCIYNS